MHHDPIASDAQPARRLGVIVGSARTGSFSQRLADFAEAHLADRYDVVQLRIDDLPIYNQDYDDGLAPLPESYARFRAEAAACEAFLFISPEHNRSFPALLKNALDVASRPYGQAVWSGKPGAVVTSSPGKFGGFGANYQLRQVLTFLDVAVMQQPEVLLAGPAALPGEDGAFADAGTAKFFSESLEAFDRWIRRLA
jgi:chromate reductase